MVIINFLKAAYHMFRLGFIIGWSNDDKAKRIITRVRWQASKIEDEKTKNILLNYINELEQSRFRKNKK